MSNVKSKKPLVSVIITTRNSAATLGELLKSVKKQSYKDVEIIVVDNKSTDGTLNIARKYTKKVFDKGPERSAQRNFGAKKAKGEYLLVLDSDMVLGKNVIKDCLVAAKNTPASVIIPESSFGKGFWAKAKALEREINRGEPYFDSARFIKKETFWEFRGYDETMTGPEDWDLPQRIAKKYKPGRIRNFIRHNEGQPSLFSYAKRKYYYGLSAHKYLKKQSLPTIGPTTVYFLRPAFYKNWRKLLKNPIVSLGMILMLLAELVGGGLGYMAGRLKSG